MGKRELVSTPKDKVEALKLLGEGVPLTEVAGRLSKTVRTVKRWATQSVSGGLVSGKKKR